MADTSNQKLFQLAKKGDIKALSKIASHSDLNSRDAYQQTALHIAAYEGHFQAVNLLLALGADPNARDKNEWTPLHSAASGDRTENHLICMEMILRKGGDPNAVTNSQASVLHYLVRCPYSEKLMSLLQLLVDKGGNIDPREEYGETPLHQACFRGASQTVQFLIKHGAGLDNLNAIGEAPLHMAARAGKKDVVLMLLSNDADPYLEGPNGDPREVAFVSNQSEIVDLFDEQERMLDAVDAMMRGHGTADDSDGEDELDAVAAVESVSKELSLSGGMDANALFGLQYVEEDLSSSTSSLDLSATPRGGGGAKKVGGLMKKMGSKATLLETAPGSPKRDSSPKLSRKGTMMLAEKLKQRRRPDARKSEKRFIQSHPGFNLELGSRSLETSSKASDISLEYTDEHDDYYFVMHFVKDPKGCFRGASAKCHLEEVDFIKHMNFVGTLDSMQCVFSVRLEPEGGNYRCIVKTPVKDTTFWLYPAEVKKLLPKYIIKAIEVRFPGTSDLVLVEDVQLSRGLVELDLILKIQKYKFGVVYCKPDQTEEEMFNNTDTSPEFEDFLNCIAQRVDLEGWTNYRGDLDVKRRFCWIASFREPISLSLSWRGDATDVTSVVPLASL